MNTPAQRKPDLTKAQPQPGQISKACQKGDCSRCFVLACTHKCHEEGK